MKTRLPAARPEAEPPHEHAAVADVLHEQSVARLRRVNLGGVDRLRLVCLRLTDLADVVDDAWRSHRNARVDWRHGHNARRQRRGNVGARGLQTC